MAMTSGDTVATPPLKPRSLAVDDDRRKQPQQSISLPLLRQVGPGHFDCRPIQVPVDGPDAICGKVPVAGRRRGNRSSRKNQKQLNCVLSAPWFKSPMLDISTAAFWIAVLQIILIDILLGGDNAVVIALACRKLPPEQRK
jgi:hypothetical protein